MEHLYIKKKLIEENCNQGTMPINVIKTEAGATKSEVVGVDKIMETTKESDTQNGYMPFLIFLVVGMILQLTSNTYCVLAGTVICVSVCCWVCIWTCVSAVLSDNKSKSLSGTHEFLE